MMRLVSLAAAAALLTACGTTVQNSGTAAAGPADASLGLGPATSAQSTGGFGAGLGDDGTPGTGDGAASLDAVGSGLDGAPTAGGGAVAPGTRTGGAGFAGGAAAPVPETRGPVRGVTDSTITIGVIDAESQDQVLADAGVKGGTQGSNERKASALVETINKAGGVGGRTLKLVVYKTNASSTPQSTCTFFTQDRAVFAVLDYGQYSNEDFRACLTKKNVVFIGDNGTHFDSQDLRRHPTLWPVNGFDVQRKIRAYIDGLAVQGYFDAWDTRTAAPVPRGEVKVGVLYYDVEFNKRQNPAIREALKKQGVAFQEFGIRMDGGGNQLSDLRASVLRFSSDGVTHVIFNQEVNGGMFGNFAVNASSQGYYPRYGVSSYDFPQLVKANVPDHKVFHGMKGIGWLPYTDVDTPAPLGPVQKACLEIFSDRGQTPGDVNERTIMLIDCDLFFKFAKVAGATGPSLSPRSFMGAIRTLGANEPCHACDRVDYSRHIDGIAAVSFLEYDQGCGCIRYTRKGIPVG